MPCNKGKVWSFRKLWLFNNNKRIKLLSSATSACLNFTLPSWLEKLEHTDSYTTDPPQHSGCPEKAQETKLFPNSLHEPIHLPDKKNARPWVFGLATRNEDLTWDPEAAAAVQPEDVCGATGDSVTQCDKWNLQCCPATLHINCAPLLAASDWANAIWPWMTHTIHTVKRLFNSEAMFIW